MAAICNPYDKFGGMACEKRGPTASTRGGLGWTDVCRRFVTETDEHQTEFLQVA